MSILSGRRVPCKARDGPIAVASLRGAKEHWRFHDVTYLLLMSPPGRGRTIERCDKDKCNTGTCDTPPSRSVAKWHPSKYPAGLQVNHTARSL